MHHAAFLGTTMAIVLSVPLSGFADKVAKAQDIETDAPTVQEAYTGSGILDRILVTGSRPVEDIGGSVHLITPQEIEKFHYSDVNRVLRQVPGVYIQEEDGFGLRPNIGLRGSGTDRSSKIALMEDGVLAAPAPYAAPSAYYFPHMGRMSAIEVAKGPAAVKYGPLTTGGAINLYSTPIPNEPGGQVLALAGEDGLLRTHAFAGGFYEMPQGYEVGALVETFQNYSGGFKQLDNGEGTGFRVEDYVIKLAARTTSGTGVNQSVEFKFQNSKERSDETYLGLTLDDFDNTPYRRYLGSQKDEMNVRHWTYQLNHNVDFGNGFDITTVAYHTRTKRSWYKLDSVVDEVQGDTRIASVLADPVRFANSFKSILGPADFVSANDALAVRANNRGYYSRGIQTALGAEFSTGAIGHLVELSVRYHEDAEDRFQYEDFFRMDNGAMVLTTAGAPGSQANRVGSAKAWSFFVQDSLSWNALTVVPGLRYETIALKREDFLTSDPERVLAPTIRSNKVDVWIPGLSLTYKLADPWTLLAGVHRGFSNPGPGSTSSAETSINYEAGVRYISGPAKVEAIGFYNDYSNLVGTCTASTGGGCAIGDQFDGGDARVVGLEASVAYDVGEAFGASIGVPISVSYTYTDAEFRTSFNSAFGPWGTVTAGDSQPFTPSHQFTFNAGLQGERWDTNLTLNYVSSARERSGTGPIARVDLIDARTVVDLSGSYAIANGVTIFASVENLFNTVYKVALNPAGSRPGKPRTAMTGLKVNF